MGDRPPPYDRREQAERFFARLAGALDAAAEALSADQLAGGNASPGNGSADATADPMLGQMVGHHRIEAQLGEGGMGVVYRAFDTRLQRTVALKFLPAHLLANRRAKERFLVEARAVAALDHPNICAIYEVSDTEGPRPFLTMGFYRGDTLAQTLSNGALPWRTALDYAIQVARGLAAAHDRGIVHRDVKPGNVVVNADGVVKLLDFGIARVRDMTITEPGFIAGTIAYMSPEQAAGRPVDARTDLWSLGVVLYEMCAGVHPFRAESTATLMTAIEQERPAPPSASNRDVPPAIDAIVSRLLEKDPAARYADANALLTDLTRAERSELLAPWRSRWRPSWRPAVALVLVILVVIAAVLSTKPPGGKVVPGGGERSIAVLPFADLSPGRDNQYLSDGMADELISALSKVGTLRVAARTSSFALRKRELSVPEIGRRLNVATVLEGSVLRERDRLRINVQLVDAGRGYNLWSKTYDQQLNQDGAVIEDMFKVQSDIAAHVIDRLDIELPAAERRRVSAAPADNHEAYTLYLKGRYFWNKRNEQDIQRALDYYYQAVDLDPGYALAWVGIADSWIFRGWYEQLAPGEAYSKAKHAALRALEFDSTLAEAHASLGNIHFEYDHDWAAAEREFLRAIQLKPAYSIAHHWYGGFMSGMGRHEQALAQAQTALQLDPLAPIIQTWGGLRYFFARKYDDAVREFQKAVVLDENFAPAHWHLSWAYLQLGRTAQAVAEANHACDLDKENLLYLASLGHAYASAGMQREAQVILTRLAEASKSRYVSAYEIALIHLALGDRDQALRSLERAYADQSVMIGYLRVDPRIDALRGDPRFERLLEKAALDF